MIVWGGGGASGQGVNTGGVYDPAADSWSATSTTNAPSGRFYHTAVWTGSRMIVWGGDTSGGPLNTGGVYDPAANSWSATSTTNAPSARFYHTAVWTGSRMIVWGGVAAGRTYVNTGGVWTPLSFCVEN
jgi:N-acetylneuraminic acid mutarotase